MFANISSPAEKESPLKAYECSDCKKHVLVLTDIPKEVFDNMHFFILHYGEKLYTE